MSKTSVSGTVLEYESPSRLRCKQVGHPARNVTHLQLPVAPRTALFGSSSKWFGIFGPFLPWPCLCTIWRRQVHRLPVRLSWTLRTWQRIHFEAVLQYKKKCSTPHRIKRRWIKILTIWNSAGNDTMTAANLQATGHCKPLQRAAWPAQCIAKVAAISTQNIVVTASHTRLKWSGSATPEVAIHGRDDGTTWIPIYNDNLQYFMYSMRSVRFSWCFYHIPHVCWRHQASNGLASLVPAC